MTWASTTPSIAARIGTLRGRFSGRSCRTRRRSEGRLLDARAADALESAAVGEWTVGREDVVLADDDGVLFVPAGRVADLLTLAETIRDTERRQADLMRSGTSLRSQVRFEVFLAQRERTPSLTFRDHLRGVGGAIEV